MIPVLSALFSGSGACASTPGAWHGVASAAQLLGPTQIDAADKALSALSKDQRATAEVALDALAAIPPGPGAPAAAGKQIQATLGTLAGTGPRRPGTDPAPAAFLSAADCVLHGLVFRSGQAVAAGADPDTAAVALLRSVRDDLKVFPEGSSGQLVAPTWVENELRLGLSPPIYLKAVGAVDAAP